MLTNPSLPLHPPSDRKFLIGLLDFGILNIVMYLSLFWVSYMGEPYFRQISAPADDLFQRAGGSPIIWSTLLVALWYPVATALGAYEPRATCEARNSATVAAKSTLVTLGLYVLVLYAIPFAAPRGSLFIFAGCTLFCVITARTLCILVLSQPRFQNRTLIIGAGKAGKALLQVIQEVNERHYQVLGFVDADPNKIGTRVSLRCDSYHPAGTLGRAARGYCVLGNCYALNALISEHQVSTLLLAVTGEPDRELQSILMGCRELGVEIIPMSVFYEYVTGRVPIEHVASQWHVDTPLARGGTSTLFRFVKRFMDIGLASLGLVCLIFLIPFIAAAIYLESPGPIFYGQERVGKGSRRFRMWKFRSMVQNAEDGGAVWARERDPRTTRVGRFLRATHIDEFPQFWNILKGEMSVVGPRPERPEFVFELEKVIPFYWLRHVVKPGMAGWGLVRQGYGGSGADARLKLQYDLYYIKHQSIFFDVVILLKAVIDSVALRGR